MSDRHENLAKCETFEGRPTNEVCRILTAKRGAFAQQHYTFSDGLARTLIRIVQ